MNSTKSYHKNNIYEVQYHHILLYKKSNNFFINKEKNKEYKDYITFVDEIIHKHEDIKPYYSSKEDLLSTNKNYNNKEINKLYEIFRIILKECMERKENT